ncbi:MAG: fibrillarin-like rRNA/tRNA 2'-O-methyltransferase [Candidatus Nezhaarchaeales archaeon]
MLIERHEYEAIYWVADELGRRLATLSLAPGVRVYDEELLRKDGKEYRTWNPYRSKLAAGILKDLRPFPIKPGCRVLYLGAASGTTCSHVSDIVGLEGRVFAVEFAPRVMREFVARVAERRPNVVAILGDARRPESYAHLVEAVDVIYQDVAQPEQGQILVDNAKMFLKPGGWALLAVKARSIDVSKEPSEVYRRELETLKRGGLKVEQVIHLEPYDEDHAMVLSRYEG